MFRAVIHIVLVLALAVLVGSVLFFGAGVASVLFQPGLLPGRTLAGAANAMVLHRLNVVAGVCAAIIPLTLGYLAFSTPRAASRIAFGVSIVLLIVVLYLGLKLFPEVNALRLEIGNFDHILAAKEPLQERFRDLHVLYSRLMQGVLFAGVGLLITHVAILARGFAPNRKTGSVPDKGSVGEKEMKGPGDKEKIPAKKAGDVPSVAEKERGRTESVAEKETKGPGGKGKG